MVITRKVDGLSIFSAVITVLIVIPIAFIIVYGFAIYHSSIGLSTVVLRSIALTIVSSAAAAIMIFLLFTPLAYHLSRSSSPMVETISDIPASIPHPIVGIAFLLIVSPITSLGRFMISIGLGLFDSIPGLITALMFVSAPVYIRAAQSIFSQSPEEPEILAMGLGMSRFMTLYRIVIPNSSRALTSAALTAMSRAISEFGSIAILTYVILQFPFAGVMPASVLIYQFFGYYGLGPAVTASALMIVISIAILMLSRIIKGISANR
jgi:molybdate/tungstate transport system permease protein